MHRRSLLPVMVLSVGAVLMVSLAVLQEGRTSILRDFQAAQAKLAQQASGDLRAYLDSFDRDTRLAAAVAERTRGQSTIDRAAQDQVIQAAFAAQVTVVEHYRTIALLGRPEAKPIVAIDPTEDAEVAPTLLAASADVARQSVDQARAVFRGPVTVGRRAFYLYGAPAGPGEAAVVSADATLMLQVAGRGRGGSQTMIVIDPNGAVWLGCEARRSCRLYEPGSREQRRLDELMHPPGSARGRTPMPALALPLPARAVIGTAPAVDSPLGSWSVALAASAAEIDEFQERLVRQTLLTSGAVVVAMLLVGFFIVRQRATAAALETRLQSAREIANLRERSERILENVPAGILGVTPDGVVSMANRFFVERIQAPQSGDAPQPPAWTRRLRVHVERALGSRRTQIVTAPDVELGAVELRDYDVRIIPLDRPADDVAALVMVEDLSELHNLQRQLVRAEKLVTVGVLSAGIAHELGTPLAVIRGRAEHLLERCLDASTGEALHAIIVQIDHISSTIRRILDFSRSEPVEGGVADARRVASRAVKLLEWRLAGKHVAVRMRMPQSLPLIAADPKQLEQMMINLLVNACDASPEGSVIELRGEVDPANSERLRIEVVDHGAGIAPEHLNTVFDPYFTTKKRGEGTGLGLAIVAQIARLHLAEVSLASSPSAGTTATISWPLAREEAMAIA